MKRWLNAIGDRTVRYLKLPLEISAPGDLSRMMILTAGAVVVAVLLVHAFAPPGLTWLELAIHMSTLTLSFVLGLMLTGRLFYTVLQRNGKPTTVGHLWLISAIGFALGVLISGLIETTGVISQVASKAASVHGPGMMLPRLLPVWAILTTFIVRAEVLRTYELRFDSLQDSIGQTEHPAAWHDEVVIESGTERHVFRHSELVRVRAEENYCRMEIYRDDQMHSVLVRSTFRSILDRLPDSIFLQVHRSHAINRNHVRKIQRRGQHLRVVLNVTHKTVPISRRRLHDVLAQLNPAPGTTGSE